MVDSGSILSDNMLAQPVPQPHPSLFTIGSVYQTSLVPRPSPALVLCKRSKAGAGEGLGMRLYQTTRERETVEISIEASGFHGC